jgi:hypothetical protein
LSKVSVIPSYGSIYAITGGKYIGEFFIYMENIDREDYSFLSLPDLKIRYVPRSKFESGVKQKILQFQEILPNNILDECKSQYEKQKTDPKSYR